MNDRSLIERLLMGCGEPLRSLVSAPGALQQSQSTRWCDRQQARRDVRFLRVPLNGPRSD
jgi:hypothetical protein